MEFAVGDIFADADILQEASEDAKQILLEDEYLEREEHQALKRYMEAYGESWASHLNL